MRIDLLKNPTPARVYVSFHLERETLMRDVFGFVLLGLQHRGQFPSRQTETQLQTCLGNFRFNILSKEGLCSAQPRPPGFFFVETDVNESCV